MVYPQEQDFRKYPDFVDYVEKWLNTKFPPSTIYRGGLKIYTSIDPDTQDAASASIQNALKGPGDGFVAHISAVDVPPRSIVVPLEPPAPLLVER